MKFSILCIFTNHGKTFTFRDIEIMTDNESMLVFKYSAMSDGKDKIACFPKSNICGWAVTE